MFLSHHQTQVRGNKTGGKFGCMVCKELAEIQFLFLFCLVVVVCLLLGVWGCVCVCDVRQPINFMLTLLRLKVLITLDVCICEV